MARPFPQGGVGAAPVDVLDRCEFLLPLLGIALDEGVARARQGLQNDTVGMYKIVAYFPSRKLTAPHALPFADAAGHRFPESECQAGRLSAAPFSPFRSAGRPSHGR